MNFFKKHLHLVSGLLVAVIFSFTFFSVCSAHHVSHGHGEISFEDAVTTTHIQENCCSGEAKVESTTFERKSFTKEFKKNAVVAAILPADVGDYQAEKKAKLSLSYLKIPYDKRQPLTALRC